MGTNAEPPRTAWPFEAERREARVLAHFTGTGYCAAASIAAACGESIKLGRLPARSLGRHADRAVEADHLTIQVGILDDVTDQASELGRLAQTGGERNHLAESILHLLRHPHQH